MKNRLFSALAVLAAFTACENNDIPEMGDHSVLEVGISELSGLSFNQNASALPACGDDGDVKSVSFDGKTTPLWSFDSVQSKIFMCSTDGTLIASYDVPFIENAESICVDRQGGCIWVGSDEDTSKIYRIEFRF